jgi:hypothetical protein
MWRRHPVPTPGTGSIVFADTTADLLKVLEAAQAGQPRLMYGLLDAQYSYSGGSGALVRTLKIPLARAMVVSPTRK